MKFEIENSRKILHQERKKEKQVLNRGGNLTPENERCFYGETIQTPGDISSSGKYAGRNKNKTQQTKVKIEYDKSVGMLSTLIFASATLVTTAFGY